MNAPNRPPLRNPTAPPPAAAEIARLRATTTDCAAYHRRVRRQFRVLTGLWLTCLALIVASHLFALPAMLASVVNVLAASILVGGTALAGMWALRDAGAAP